MEDSIVDTGAEQLERGRMLGNALRNARGARTMVEVASAAGVSVEALRKIETGRSPSPEFFTVAQICGALDISTAELVADPVAKDDSVRWSR